MARGRHGIRPWPGRLVFVCVGLSRFELFDAVPLVSVFLFGVLQEDLDSVVYTSFLICC